MPAPQRSEVSPTSTPQVRGVASLPPIYVSEEERVRCSRDPLVLAAREHLTMAGFTRAEVEEASCLQITHQ